MVTLSARLALGLTFALAPILAEADELAIGVPDWPSAAVSAEVIGQTLANAFGISIRYEQKSSMRVLTGLANGELDIHPELWLPNLQAHLDRISLDGDGIQVGSHGVLARQGMCVSDATMQMTGIATLADLSKPSIASQFDTDGDGLGEVWIGAPMWTSTLFEQVRAQSLGYDKTMKLLEYDEAVAMAGVDAAVAFDKPVVFFCYAPHHIFELHDITFLDEEPHDPASWNVLTRADDADWLSKSTATTAWAPSHYHIAFARQVTADHPQVARFLAAIAFLPEDAAIMSYAMEVEGLSATEAATRWLDANQARVSEWLE